MGLLFEELVNAALEALLEISGGGGGKVEARGKVARLPNPIDATVEKRFESLFAAEELTELSF